MRKRFATGSVKRWAIVPGLAIALALGVPVVQTLLAVHDTGAFEMDGNAATSLSHDWDQVYADKVNGTSTSGATATSFNTDNLLNDGESLQATIFTGGGSKDPQDISSWAWKDGAGGLPDKDNLLHSFAARYSLPPTNPADNPAKPCYNGTGGPGQPTWDPTKPCEVLFFGSDRYDNSGDAQQGFWFFQNAIGLGSNAVGGGSGFTGVHKKGDLLIISDFSNGGTTSTITIYQWDPVCTATNKPDGGCGDANLRKLASSDAANCGTATSGDAFCGIVNPGPGLTTSPWDFLDKSGNANFLNGEFYEGGVNLSLLGLAGECFASVASETRSSTSTTATLKDFILGGFARCETGLVTTPKDGSGNNIPAGGLSIGTGSVSVKDSAALTISGVQTWTGTLDFYLCGPTFGASYAPCTTGGTKIGSSITVNNTDTQPILSAAATLTSVGKYCWRGEFTSGTSGVPNAKDPDPAVTPAPTNECFTVTPKQPSISTAASGNVVLGNAVSDSANLSGTANKPGDPIINGALGVPAGGTITFRLYGPDDATCSGTPAFTSSAILVSGDNLYASGNFTPKSAGTYRWIASYTGDSPNTLSVAGACNDLNESVVVSPKIPTIVTVATAGPVNLGNAIDDTATLSGTAPKPDGTAAGGTITFSLYGPSASPVCTTAIATRTVTVSGDGNYKASDGTGTGSLTPTQAGTYYWIAAYSGDAPNTVAATGACGDTNEASVVQQLQPTIATAQTFTIKDSATIGIGSLGGGNLAGTVRFRLYNNTSCDTTSPNELLYDSNTAHPTGIPLPAGTALSKTVESDVFQITVSKPQLSWLVEYTSTNAGHKNVTSACNTERASLTIVNQ